MASERFNGAGKSASRRIEDALLSIVERGLGRRPSSTQAFLHDDLVVCLVRGTQTPGERRLATDHGERVVRNARWLLEESIRDDANDAIEEISGRRVASYMSDYDPVADQAALVFALRSAYGDGAPDFVAEPGG